MERFIDIPAIQYAKLLERDQKLLAVEEEYKHYRETARGEVDLLRSELAAERKKREEAERQICKTCGHAILEAQVEALRDTLELWLTHIDICDEADEDCDEGFLKMLHSRTKAIKSTTSALANLTASAEKVRKVLEAAKKVEAASEDYTYGFMTFSQTTVIELINAVRELEVK